MAKRKGTWLRNPDALRTLVALRGVMFGDEVLELNHVGGTPTEHRTLLQDTGSVDLEEFCKYYDKPGCRGDYWQLVGWRRPKR